MGQTFFTQLICNGDVKGSLAKRNLAANSQEDLAVLESYTSCKKTMYVLDEDYDKYDAVNVFDENDNPIAKIVKTNKLLEEIAMKTSEFKQAVEELGFDLAKVGHNSERWYILRKGNTVGLVIPLEYMVISTKYEAFSRLNISLRTALAELLFIYAATPLDEREPERKWYIKCPITGYYLNRDKDEDNRFVWTVS
ncbi:hypothetical protein, partial [Listeria newyorkensis]